jgi:regulatory protein
MSRTTYERALSLLEHRPRSVAELRRKLLQKGDDPSEVEAVIARLCDQRLLDDTEFARQFARSRIVGAGSSRWRIVQELARKGVAREIADDAVAGLEEREGIDPAAAIHRVAEKKWKTLAKLDDPTRRRRLYAFLARRGFNPEEIRYAMNALAAEALDA